MNYSGRLLKRSIYDSTGEPNLILFSVEGDTPEKALEKAQKLLIRAEIFSASTFVVKSELNVDGKWREFGPKGWME